MFVVGTRHLAGTVTLVLICRHTLCQTLYCWRWYHCKRALGRSSEPAGAVMTVVVVEVGGSGIGAGAGAGAGWGWGGGEIKVRKSSVHF